MAVVLSAVAEEGDVSAQIRWRDGLPLAFLYSGRLYMVRQIELRTSGRFRVVAVAGRSGPPERFDVVFDAGIGEWAVERLAEQEP